MKPSEAIKELGLIKSAVEWDYPLDWQIALDLAISALEKQEQGRWIPVTERLPEEDGEYLVTYEKGYAEEYCLDSIGIAPFEADRERFGAWKEYFDPLTLGSLGGWCDISVMAWRSLPVKYLEDIDE